MEWIINTVYGWITLAAAAASTIWGLAKAVGAFKKWCGAKWAKHKERREMLPNLIAMNKDIGKRLDKME